MSTTAAGRVDADKGRKKKTADINRNWTPVRDQLRAPYRIPTDLPPILFPNPNPHCCRLCLVQKCVGRGGGPTWDLGRMGKVACREMRCGTERLE